MKFLKFMVKCSIVMLVLSSHGAISECRASDEDYVEPRLRRSGMSFTPQWMPDGETIVVSRDERLHTIDVGTGQVEILSQKTRSPSDILQIDYSPSVSPEGSRIAFTTHRFVNDGHYSWDIAMLEFDENGELRRRRRQLGPLSWSLDGEAIQLTRSKGRDRNPLWSPDGSRIAFFSDRVPTRPASDRLYVMAADGSNVVSVAPDIAVSSGPFAWSPDGKKLAFTSKREYLEDKSEYLGEDLFRTSLYVVGSEGSGIELVWEGFEGYITSRAVPLLAWSPDGSKIAIAIARNGVFVADTTRPTHPRLIRDLGNDTPYGLFWTPAGDEVLYYADGTLRGYYFNGILWGSTTDGRNTRVIWAPENGTLNAPSGDPLAMSMSPNGSQIAAYSLDYGRFGIDVALISLDGSAMNLVEYSDWPDLSEFWTIY